MSAAQLTLFPEPQTRQKPRKANTRNVHIVPAVRVQRGDLWQLGAHRLLCGDATCEADTARLMSGAKVDSCVTDPPYGIAWNTEHRRFTSSLDERYGHLRRRYVAVANDTQVFDPRPLLRFRSLVLFGANYYAASLPIGSWLVWDKRLPDGRALLADAEMAWMKGGKGVYIFAHMWQGWTRANKGQEPNVHPTQKPVALMAWCLAKSNAGAAVYDPYCGSGPVLLACERTERRCHALEIEPQYCDVILARWEQATGHQATLLDRAAGD